MKNIIVSFLVLSQIIFPRFLLAEESHVPSIIVLPVVDGDLDSETEEITRSLQYLLTSQTGLRIVSEEQVKDILQYRQETVSSGISVPEDLLIKAKEQYHKADLRKARDLAEELIQRLESNQDLRSSGAFLEEAYLLKAICSWAFRDKKAVAETFKKLLGLNPLFKVSSDLFPPQFARLFEETHLQFEDQATAQVSFDTSPAGADVYLNGIKQCTTPCEALSLPIGFYQIGIKASRYEEISDVIRLETGKPVKYERKLVWNDKFSEAFSDSQTSETNLLERVRYAVKIGKTVKVDKAVLINARSLSESKAVAVFRLVDIEHESGQIPFSFKFRRRQGIPEKHLSGISTTLTRKIAQDVSSNPSPSLDPKGLGDAALFGKKKKKITKQPLFWIGIGAGVLTGIIFGILGATSGGGSSEKVPQQTKIKLKIE